MLAMCLPWTLHAQNPSFIQEGFEGGSLPSGWTANSSDGWYVSTEAVNYDDDVLAHGGQYFIGLECDGEGTHTLRLPALDLSQTTNPVISFWYLNPDWDGDQNSFRMSYRTSANSNNWTNIGQAYSSDVTTWTQVNVAVPNAARNASYFQLRIRVTDSYGYDVCFDDFFVGELPGCLPPSGLATTQSDWDNMDFTFGWNANADAQGYNVVFSETTVTDFDNATVDYTTDNFYSVYGLTPSTTYHLYVQTDCGDDASSWAHYAFTTVQTYNMASTGTATLGNACGYTIYDNGGPSGNYANNANSTLTITANPGQVMSIAGTVDMEGYSYDNLEIYDGLTASGTDLVAGVSEGAIGPFESATGAFTIHYYSDNTENQGGFALSVTCVAEGDCPRPGNLAVTGYDTTTVSLAWEGTDYANYEVVWGPVGCDPDAMLDAGVNYANTTDPFITIDPLPSGQYFDFYVRTWCGTEGSSWRGPVSAGTVLEHIMAHSGTDTLRNACGYVIYDEGGANGQYTDNADATLILLPTPGNIITISGTCQTEASYDHLYIYDGIGTSGTQLCNLTGTQTVGPFESTSGPLTIRFTSDGSTTSAGFQLLVGCQSADCLRPAALTAAHIGSDEVTLAWTENGEAAAWYVAYDTTPITDFESLNYETAFTNPFTVTGLESTTTYYFYVASDCSSAISQWAGPLVVTTGFECEEGDFFTVSLTATNTDYNTLINGVYGNSVSQSIITVEELHAMGLQAGYIRKMKLNCTSTGTLYAKNRSIYLAATSESTFTSTSSMIGGGTFTRVWQNTAHTFELGENEFIFDTAYLWDGASNLCVMFFNNQDATSGSTSTDNSGSPYLSNTSGATIKRYRDDSPYTLAGFPTEGTRQNVTTTRPAWTFEGCTVEVNCPAPSHFVATNALANAISVAWQSPETASQWDIAISDTPTASPETLATLAQAYATQYTFTGLNPQTAYYVYLRSNCGSDQSAWITLQVSTTCADATLPFAENFDGYAAGIGTMVPCWTVLNRSTGYYQFPYLASGTYAHSGNGIQFGGWETGLSGAAIVATPRIPAPANQLEVSFWMKSESTTGTAGDMILGWTPTLTSLDSIITVATLPAVTVWTYREVSLASFHRADTGYFVFYTNGTSSGFYSGLDEVEIAIITGCSRPNDLALSATADSIVVTWSTVGDGTETYELSIGDPTDANSTLITGITGGSYTDLNVVAGQTYTYYVRTNCGSDVSEWRGPVSATASNVFNLPVSGSTTLTTCSLTIYDNGGPDDNYATSCNGTLVLNPLPGHTLLLSGTYNTEQNYDVLTITVDGMSHTYSGQGTLNLASDNGSPITINFQSDESVVRSGFEIQVSCEMLTGCVRPADFRLYNAGMTSATLGWTPMGAETEWQVTCNDTTYTVTSPTVTLTGLTAETQYTATLVAVCGTDDLSNPATLTFSTARCDGACPLVVEMVDEYGDGWNDAAIHVVQGTFTQTLTLLDDEESDVVTLYACPGDTMRLTWVEGEYDNECSFTITDWSGDALYTCAGCEPANGSELLAYWPDCGPAAPTCDVPTLLGATNVDYQGATINWNGQGQNYEVQLLNHGMWDNVIAVQGMSHTFSGLQAATRYQYRVRQDCDTLGYSDWASDAFTTDSLPCLAPTNLRAEWVSGTRAELAWTPAGNEEEWEVRYSTQGDTLSVTVPGEAVAILENLVNPATYTAQVRALCGGGAAQSDWSEPVEFATTNCEPVSDITFSNITTNSATVTWTSNGPATTWTVNFGYANHWVDEPIHTYTVEGTPTLELTGLSANTSYDVVIQAVCAEGWVSDQVRSESFRTLDEQQEGIDQANATAISLYPNPATSEVTIEGYEGEVVIVDMTGRVVITTSEKTIDIRSLSTGAYFVKMGTEVKKLIVK